MISLLFRKMERGETDELVQFFSRDLGWLRGVAKNSLKSRIRFAGHLEPLSLVELTLRNRQRDEMVWIDDSYVHEGFLGIRESLNQIAISTLFVDIARVFLQENNPDERVFDFLAQFLRTCNDGFPEKTFVLLDGIYLLSLLGYQPQVIRCSSCGKELVTSEEAVFSFEHTGVMHSACVGNSGSAITPMSWETISVIRKALELPRESYSRLRLNKRGLTELWEIFRGILLNITGYEMNTLHFVEKMRILTS